MTLVPGDPASLSACAASTGAAGRRLAAEARALDPEVAALAEGWTGRVSVSTRRRGAALAEAGSRVAHEMEQVAALLQDQATDLAELTARARLLEERAAAVGLEVRDGRITSAYGVRGEADAATEARQVAAVAGLQAELDLVLAQHRRRRDFVLGALRESSDRLATLSHDLRRG